MWLNVTAWEKLAEIVEKYAFKGMQVFVQGKLVMRPYKDKSGVDRQSIDIVASTVQLLDKKQNGGAQRAYYLDGAGCIGYAETTDAYGGVHAV